MGPERDDTTWAKSRFLPILGKLVLALPGLIIGFGTVSNSLICRCPVAGAIAIRVGVPMRATNTLGRIGDVIVTADGLLTVILVPLVVMLIVTGALVGVFNTVGFADCFFGVEVIA